MQTVNAKSMRVDLITRHHGRHVWLFDEAERHAIGVAVTNAALEAMAAAVATGTDPALTLLDAVRVCTAIRKAKPDKPQRIFSRRRSAAVLSATSTRKANQ